MHTISPLSCHEIDATSDHGRVALVCCCYDRKSSAVSSMTSSNVVEFASGDGVTSSDGRGSDIDEVIFVEGPHGEGKDPVELSAVDVYSSVLDVTSTTASRRHFQAIPTTTAHQMWIKPGTRLRERTSSRPTSTTVMSSGNEPAQVRSTDEEDGRRSTPPYMALVVNVALLAGIIFVVAVLLAVLVSFAIHRRRQRHQGVTSSAATTAAPVVVSRPRIKAAYDGFTADLKHVAIAPPTTNKPRLFVGVSKVGDPKEWFV